MFLFMEKEKHHIPEDNILNEHVASITEAIASKTINGRTIKRV